MTNKNKELRSLVTRIENACTACLRSQPNEDDDCERELTKTLSNIANMVSGYAGLVEIEIYDIDWDTDGEDVDLPKSVKKMVHDYDIENDDDIVDMLSDEYGWLVNSCNWRRT